MIHIDKSILKINVFICKSTQFKNTKSCVKKNYKFAPVKTNDSQKKYQLPVEIAKFFIDTMMYDYFTGDATARKEKSRKRAEEARDRTLKDMETKSLEKDKQMGIEKGAGDINAQLYDEIMSNPTDATNIRMKEKFLSL